MALFLPRPETLSFPPSGANVSSEVVRASQRVRLESSLGSRALRAAETLTWQTPFLWSPGTANLESDSGISEESLIKTVSQSASARENWGGGRGGGHFLPLLASQAHFRGGERRGTSGKSREKLRGHPGQPTPTPTTTNTRARARTGYHSRHLVEFAASSTGGSLCRNRR